MTNKLLNIAKRITPVSIRIGVDVDILDIKQGQYEYCSDKMNGCFDNSVVAIQMKHKFIKEPFWITLFAGAQRKESNITFVAAYSDNKTDYNYPLYEIDAIEPEELEEGSESLQEIIDAFDYMYFTEDDAKLDIEPLFYSDPMVVSDIADKILEESNVVIYHTVLSRKNPSEETIRAIQLKLNKVTKTKIKNVWTDEGDYNYGSQEDWLIHTNADLKSVNISNEKYILYISTIEKILKLLETNERYTNADFADFRTFLRDLIHLDADMYIF